jgi:hypothetical protein
MPLASASGTPEGSALGDSSITGSSALKANPSSWEDLASRFEDGSIHLGYEKGEILKMGFGGSSFDDIVLESPLAASLDLLLHGRVETALTDYRSISENARLAKGNTETEVTAAAGTDTIAPAQATRPVVQLPSKLPAQQSAASLLANARSLAAKTNGKTDAGRELASVAPVFAASAPMPQQSEIMGTNELSLFQRISTSYRKHAPGMRMLGDTKTSDAIKAMGVPEEFRNL